MPETDQERVAQLCARARLALAIGMSVLEGQEGPCDCRYPDGEPRFVTPDKKIAHRCGR